MNPFPKRRESHPRARASAPEAAELITEIIRSAGAERPADQALREGLKAWRDLPPFVAAEVSSAVFNHYRWLGWTRALRNLEAKLRQARVLAQRFAANPGSFSTAELAAHAVPEWTHAHQEVPDAWLRSLQREPRLWLRARIGQGGTLTRRLADAQETGLADALWYTGTADLFRTAEFHAGEFEIQDIASQCVGLLCDPRPGETWWDACAGEGGKLLHLSDLMANKGLIWASDRAAWRLQKLQRRAARAKVFNYRSVPWDGGAKLPTRTKFDGILVDAPCSGIGTWQRNPHARWTTTPGDVTEMAQIQKQLLDHAAAALKPGGKLIYSVCTLTTDEGPAVAAHFTTTHPEFEPLALPVQKLAGILPPSAPPTAMLTLWPQDLEGNGMFIAAWRKR